MNIAAILDFGVASGPPVAAVPAVLAHAYAAFSGCVGLRLAVGDRSGSTTRPSCSMGTLIERTLPEPRGDLNCSTSRRT